MEGPKEKLTYAVPPVVMHVVVRDRGVVAVIVGVEAVADVVVHVVTAPVPTLVAERVVPEELVVDLRVRDVSIYGHLVQKSMVIRGMCDGVYMGIG